MQTVTPAPRQATRDVDNGYRRLKFILWLNILSLALQLSGFVSPGWQVHSEQSVTRSFGLWYVRYCYNGGCSTFTLEVLDIELYYRTERIETSIALAAIVIATALSLWQRRIKIATFHEVMSAYISLVFWCMLSGILSLSSSGREADHTIEDLNSRRRSTSSISIEFPYSVLLTGLGGITSCIVVLTSLYAMYCLLKHYSPGGAAGSHSHGYTSTLAPQSHLVSPAYHQDQIGIQMIASPHIKQQGMENGGFEQPVAPPTYQSDNRSNLEGQDHETDATQHPSTRVFNQTAM